MTTPDQAPTFKLGDLVWAKMKGFSPWPGRVSAPGKDMKKPANSKHSVHCIYFFGTRNYGWIDINNIQPYQERKETCMKLCKTAAFKDACKEIEEFIASGEIFEDGLDPDSLFDKLKEESITEKKTPKIKPKRLSTYINLQETPKEKRVSTGSVGRPAKKQRTYSETSSNNRLGSLSPALNHSTPVRKSTTLLDRPANISRPITPPLDVETLSQTLKDKNIHASSLKFGFLGLGIMGSGIVKNLLNSGHKVIVWNRTEQKCADFVKAGAEQGLTPSDVVLMADITFSCVADPQAAKEIVFGNCGVLSEITSEKGYVEMTGIDSETSQDIAEAITAKGARYLEAQVQGSKKQAEEGTLVILAAGERQLFDDCNSCFGAMGKNTFFLGEVGKASKINLVLQLMTGVTIAGLAECMALADRAGLQQKDIVEILELTSLACPGIIDRANAIIDGNFTKQLPLRHMQKDLQLSLNMSDQFEQPIPLCATTNEIYKHAKRLGYGEHDASAVYIRARF